MQKSTTIISFLFLLLFLPTQPILAEANDVTGKYIDLQEDASNSAALKWGIEQGIIGGYYEFVTTFNGTEYNSKQYLLKPEKPVTEAQFLAMFFKHFLPSELNAAKPMKGYGWAGSAYALAEDYSLYTSGGIDNKKINSPMETGGVIQFVAEAFTGQHMTKDKAIQSIQNNEIFAGLDNSNLLNDPNSVFSRGEAIALFYELSRNDGLAIQQVEPYLYDVQLSEDEALYLSVNGRMELHKAGVEEHTYIRATDTVHTFSVMKQAESVATYELTIRELDNGDQFIFSKIINKSDTPVEIKVTVPGSSDSFITFDRYDYEHKDDADIGYDPTTYPQGIIKLGEKEIVVGKNYRSRQLVKEYKNGDQSFMRELFEERKVYDESGESLEFSVVSEGNDISEHWFLYGRQQLFLYEATLDEWIHESTYAYRKTNAWYTAEGPYNKMVLTTEPQPHSKLGYGRTLLLFKEDKALERYTDTGDRYFYDLLINSLVNLDIFKGNKTYWETEVTSMYLKNLYGMHAPFIDTRFNEQTALFIYETGKALGIEDSDYALVNYADLLVEQIASGNVIGVPGGGGLIPDYFSVHEKVTTHMSLNHGLGGMNLLLETYLATGETKYLKAASWIDEGIASLGAKWLKPNGDTYYKINTDLTFVGKDYLFLTAWDLEDSIKLWNQVDPTRILTYELLLESKLRYLEASGY